MENPISVHAVDYIAFVVANLVNILVVGVFLSRTKGLARAEFILGIIIIVMALPLCAVVICNILDKRDWWAIVLPLLLVLYCVVELMLDYVLHMQFRNTALLFPYLTIFYLGLLGMVGYSFGIGKIYGTITLCTYFLTLIAAWYSYSQVGHG